MRLANPLRDLPRARQGFVLVSVRIGWCILTSWTQAEDLGFPRLVDQQSVRLGLFEHPLQGDFGKAALFFRIAATDIAMHPGEPDLLHVPGTMHRRRICRWHPPVGAEEGSAFVNRN